MNKNAIKKFASQARLQLIEKIKERAFIYGIRKTETYDPEAKFIDGYILSDIEIVQRKALIAEIERKSYDQVIEEAAYTWFNRFIALRFMEVNNYLPTKVRVFTDQEGAFKPQILQEAIHLDMDGLDINKVYEFKEKNQDDELYKYLIITQCNALSQILPEMFQKISDYTELLLPDNLLKEGSIIDAMINLIDEEDFKDAVQIIGWLYQYYNSEKKDQVFADLKKNIKVSKENIPAATQLFTPDWIVRYMVENSLGRLWQEGHPEANLAQNWDYYLDGADQDIEVEEKLDNIRQAYKNIRPEEIKCIDPCSGSGHILVYMFDILMDIYISQGYTSRDAVASIVKNNLYALELDERACQLTYFAIMMKACQYDKRFLNRKIAPHAYVIEESNKIHIETLDYFVNGDNKLKLSMDTLVEEMTDAKEYGSIINITDQDWDMIYRRLEEIENESDLQRDNALDQIGPMVKSAQALAQKYDVVVTNPPYMGTKNMNPKLTSFIKKNYADYKSDLFSVFVVRCTELAKESGYIGFLTPYVWMFIKSYEKMREYIYESKTIETLIQFEYSAFEEATVPICTFVLKNNKTDKKGCYIRLTDFRGGMEVQRQKALEAINNPACGFYYEANEDNFTKIPGSPVAYWVSDSIANSFLNGTNLKDKGDTRQGMATSDNNRFLRLWFEVNYKKIGINFTNAVDAENSRKKWFPYNKGGQFRKWYGNIEYTVNYENDGKELKEYAASKYKSYTRTIKSISEYFKDCLSWSKISSGDISFRYYPNGFIFDVAGCCIFYKNEDDMYYDFGFINSKVALKILSAISPTLNYEAGHIASLPIIRNKTSYSEVRKLVHENISLSKTDWDSFETSWDFVRHPLVRDVDTISQAFDLWQAECDERFQKLKANEEELNRIFIDIYGLGSELDPEVADEDVTVARADLDRDIRSFISYVVGCMFGRYSLDEPGLIYAGGDFDPSKYNIFKADVDNILPISDDEYFKDDIVSRFIKFVETVYGAEKLDENLDFIANALPGKGLAKDVIRSYFLNDFYKDHLKTYQKRPIYWLFDSGKKNGFKCLIYMHRYKPDILARIRTDYVHEHQARYHTSIMDLEERIKNADTKERVKLDRKLKSIKDQDREILAYEEKIHHLADQMIDFDLDDGVKENYELFKDVLAKIK